MYIVQLKNCTFMIFYYEINIGTIANYTWPIVPRAFSMRLVKRMGNAWFLRHYN